MLSVAIHKDIAEYQPKVIGKLTGRTLISITVALGLPARLALHRRAPWVYHVAVYPAVPRREVRSSRSARNN